MDDNDSNEVVEQTSTPEEEEELSHSDKMIGILSEPSKTFESISKFPPKTIDWLLPIFLLLLFVAVSRIIVLNNDEIKFDAKQKQIAKIEETMQKAVTAGKMTQQQADQQLEKIQEQMDKFGGGIGTVIQTVGIFIVGFIIFFIMTGIYYLFIKFLLKGEGTFTSALVANGLTAYIAIIAVIIAAILSLVFSRMFNDVSVAAFMNTDKTTFLGFILGRLDIITIWVYIVLSIGFAKMFKSVTTGKYYGLVFGIWIIGSFLLFLLSKSFPFLNF